MSGHSVAANAGIDVAADVAAISRIGAVPTILKVVSEVTGLRLALVARVTENAWTACAVLDQMNFGLEVGGQLAVATTLCSEVRDSHEPIIIEHASIEPEYCAHPTPKMYGFESYIAVPIMRPNGEYFGNVCALDPAPARLREAKTVAMMRLFAELIGLQLAAEEASGRDREALSVERETAELREQFIAVLGHDLRNPLSAVVASAGFLLTVQPDHPHRSVLERIRGSSERMTRLIDDIMDFARGRLGGGITLRREPIAVSALLGDVVGELASAHPDRTVRLGAPDVGRVSLDRARIAQMLSNLVANAIEHGTPGTPVDVTVTRTTRGVSFAVTNAGTPIPPDVVPRLFQPYFRAGDNRTGLGLGLYIAAEIARAHGGTVAVTSTPDGVTTFTVDMPDAPSSVTDDGAQR